MRTRKHLLAIMGVASLVAAAVMAASVSASPSKKLVGGTYTVGWESSFGFTSGFDPTGEYLGDAMGPMANLLVRTLVGTRHVGGAAGNLLVPDLATSLPKPTNGGKTYTFKLKNGVRFGPPVSRGITSKDFATALTRLANPKNGAQYAFYYSVIRGFDAVAKGAKSISGIKTPNDKTIVFNLTSPTPDFLYRVMLPATGPMPAEVTKCFEGKANVYGRNLVSSGPYMFEGSDKVDISSCSTIKPASGYDGQTKMILVRNPEYRKSTDTTRENNPDRFEFLVNTNTDDIFNKTKAGDYDDQNATEPAKIIREYSTGSLKSRMKNNPGDRTWYITLNLTQPPFDDIHIRKAMNWVLDKDSLRKVWGGPTAGDIGTHIAPPEILGGLLKKYDPYRTPGSRGDETKAKNEVKQSKYDSDKDGVCDAKECQGVLLITDTRGVDPGMATVLQASAKKIGVTFTVRQIKGAYPTIQTTSKNVPIASRPGWGKDFADPGTFFDPLFFGPTIIPTGNTNYSLVGVKPSQSKQLGLKGNVNGVANVDKEIKTCQKTVGDERFGCYANLDRTLMEKVVPWVPWLFAKTTFITGPNVTKWVYDQQWTTPAYSRVAVKG